MKHIKLYEDFLNEEATTSWSKMMKGVRAGGSGPWSIVAIEDKKVVGQSIDIKTPDLIPAKYEALKRECPKAKLHIEDGGGMVVWNGPLNEGVSQDAVYIHQIIGCGQNKAQDFIDDNDIDGAKLAAYVKQHRNSKEQYDVRDIIAGTGVGAIKDFRERFIKSVQESQATNMREWQGTLIDLRDNDKLPSEFNQIGKDMIRKYPTYKDAKCWFNSIRYNEDGSVNYVGGEIQPQWKTYRRKNFYFEVSYRFKDRNIETSKIEQYSV